MKIGDITAYLETIAPLQLQENYDNSGLLTGDKNDIPNGILVCLDCTEAVVDEAIKRDCNMIVAHHPIIFSGLKQLTGENYVQKTIIKAIRNNIAIYSIHTNLDNSFNAVNKTIADKLKLENCRILRPVSGQLKKLVTFVPVAAADLVRAALFSAGAGGIGNYDLCSFNLEGTGTFRANENAVPFVGKVGELHREPEIRIEVIFQAHQERTILAALNEAHPYEEVACDIYRLDNSDTTTGAGMIGDLKMPMNAKEFLLFIKRAMQCSSIRHTEIVKEQIKKVAVCGGSGSFLLGDAIAAGADVFISADFKYHQFFDAEGRIIIADIGHYESEQFTIDMLCEVLKNKFPTFAVHFSKINTNPVNYI